MNDLDPHVEPAPIALDMGLVVSQACTELVAQSEQVPWPWPTATTTRSVRSHVEEEPLELSELDVETQFGIAHSPAVLAALRRCHTACIKACSAWSKVIDLHGRVDEDKGRRANELESELREAIEQLACVASGSRG